MPGFYAWVGGLAACAAAATWVARHYALRGNLMDQPGERRSHAVATPRGGGIAIVLVVVVASGYLMMRQASLEALWLAFVPGLLIVAGVGWWDDHRPLSPWLRLAVQAVAALMLAVGAGWQTGHWLPALVAFMAAMALVNVWNFMDGINGLATTQAALAALSYAVLLTGTWHWLALALLAGCVGFLPFNFPKARIFLGDVGSGALGYMLAALVTLSGRILRGEQWWTPHVGHLYQVMARRYGHTAVTLIYIAFGGVSVLLSYVMAPATFAAGVCMVAALYGVGGALWVLLRRGWRI
jgi:UDP-N-acetylmuramyl pentapeptide phosphotransferase/UDP-N-acetylglucosamine-1-phosphate transferase